MVFVLPQLQSSRLDRRWGPYTTIGPLVRCSSRICVGSSSLFASICNPCQILSQYLASVTMFVNAEQLYKAWGENDTQQAPQVLQLCEADIKMWRSRRHLKFNAEKMELLPVNPRYWTSSPPSTLGFTIIWYYPLRHCELAVIWVPRWHPNIPLCMLSKLRASSHR